MVVAEDVGAPTASNTVVADDGQRRHATLANPEDQPWSVVMTWLELRHSLAVVALLQVRARVRGTKKCHVLLEYCSIR